MTCSLCQAAWEASRNMKRAETFDEQFPDCACEQHEVSTSGPAVADGDVVAHLITSPKAWDEQASTMLWTRMMLTYSIGLSFFRAGSKESEIAAAVDSLVNNASQPQKLIGATIVTAGAIRALEDGERYFCVYDTDAEEFSMHVDIVGRWVKGLSKNKWGLTKERRQKALRDELNKNIVFASDANELVTNLRAAGFYVI